MGKNLPQSANPATGTPGAQDRANVVVSGQFTAVGQVSQPVCIYGAFNVSLWSSIATSLTTNAASAVAAVTSNSGLAAGQGVISTLVPPGTVIASVGNSTTTIGLGGLTNTQIAALTTATDAAAIFVGIGTEATGTVILERSFDGGTTWLTCGVGGAGAPASYVFGSAGITNPVSFTASEPEQGVAYRLNCAALSAGNINYRISTTGLAATPWGIAGN